VLVLALVVEDRYLGTPLAGMYPFAWMVVAAVRCWLNHTPVWSHQ
jgi:hypothetical protein